ncbi:MAG: multicopper oxidase domain-containing protein [Solirubrobacterales bacterium]
MSRRRLLAGGALATASLPAVHALVPHQGVHRALDGSASASEGAGAHAGHGSGAGPLHARFRADQDVDHRANGFDPTEMLRDFDYGSTRRLPGGGTLREWEITALDKEIEIAPGVSYPAWTYNGRVPGPALRCTEGDRLRLRFTNASSHPHTIHFHGIHSAVMDGMPGIGEAQGGGQIESGESFDYEFDAKPFGTHLYHCHVSPLAAHIAKGLYGAFIIDPKQGRAPADEMVMVMNAFDTNFDSLNEVYAVNTVGFHYQRNPIQVKRDELVRIHLVNATEYDLVNSFHLHANFFDYYPTGTSLEPNELTDTIIQGQGQRGMLEMRFPNPGRYMFHAHITEFAELGWSGFFEVS